MQMRDHSEREIFMIVKRLAFWDLGETQHFRKSDLI